ncbi:MAG: SEC-C metal-binding domain-containing protein, partial [Pirellula sp.]
AGVREAERLAGVESFYTVGNMEWPHLIDNALKAHQLYRRDVNYVNREGEIIIVDEFTGRLMEGRQWSDGLHQAVEAKEGVKIKEETQTLATITLQNFFKLYKKLSGMTGTAMTEAQEFSKIYKLGVVEIPSNRRLQRIEFPDAIYLSEKEKYEAVADEIDRVNKHDTIEFKDRKKGSVVGNITRETDDSLSLKKADSKEVIEIAKSDIDRIERAGRPILIGTVSIEKSEKLAALLEQRGVKHQVLNAKAHKREAEIIAQAGRVSAVTIATNMAGRGTDIILGGNPETMAWAQLQNKYQTRLDVPKEEWEGLVQQIKETEKMEQEGEYVRGLGGLYVIGTERHESRRIDLQLRGRCGRQGDPGSSRFFLSLEDDLMRIFAGDWVRAMMQRMGMGDGEAIESPYVSKRISGAQKKVEERHFEARKNLLEYDEVMDHQRKRVYTYRQQVLEGKSCRELVMHQLREQIESNVDQFCDPMFGPESYARWAGPRLGVQLEAKDFRGIEPQTAILYAKDQAERAAETQIHDAIDENLPSEEEQSDWNWDAMAKWVNNRFNTNYTVGMLKKIDRDRMDEEFIGKANTYIEKIELDEGEVFLDPEYGNKMLAAWMKNKFGIDVNPIELKGAEPETVKKIMLDAAEKAYFEREIQFPVLVGFHRFRTQTGPNSYTIDGEALSQWAAVRFQDPNVLDKLRANSEKPFDALLEISRAHAQRSKDIWDMALSKLDGVFGKNTSKKMSEFATGQNSAETLAVWMQNELSWKGTAEDLVGCNREDCYVKLSQAFDDRYHPEIRRMERTVLLQTLDSSWKDHLLAMDHVRSSVGFRSMGQMDPKVEFKREGMRLFDQMWLSIGEQITDVIFRMEAVEEGMVESSFVETSARHDAFDESKFMSEEKIEDLKAADQAGTAATEPKTIRNRGEKAGRNDPCPCGSGKKFKNCCTRKQI